MLNKLIISRQHGIADVQGGEAGARTSIDRPDRRTTYQRMGTNTCDAIHRAGSSAQEGRRGWVNNVNDLQAADPICEVNVVALQGQTKRFGRRIKEGEW